MTDEEILKIIEDAKAATQGAWSTLNGVVIHVESKNYLVNGILFDRDIPHIANCCPANIAPLLEELLVFRNLYETREVRGE